MLDDVQHFAEVADKYLRRERFSANVIATTVEAVCRGAVPPPSGAAWVVVREGDSVQGVAMHTPPFPLFLPRLEHRVVDALAGALQEAGRTLPGVTGERTTVARFAEVWHARTGQTSRRRASTRMYVLGTLRPPHRVSGGPRLAVAPDAGLVAEWLSEFHDEAAPGAPTDDWAAAAHRHIAHGSLWLWVRDDMAVSMAAVRAPAAGVARIGPVFTPPGFRRSGYGAGVTAAASRAAIDAGAEDVVLYADLSNSDANSIYRAIGYLAHHDAETRDFEKGAPGRCSRA